MYNVLIVDDEPRTADALEKNIDWQSCGIGRVFRAMSLRAALEVMEQQQVDILISDIEMPNGSGLQLLENLRERGKKISCIFVTCHPEFDYMRKAIQLQCSDYILKPIQYDELSRVLVRLIHRMETGAQEPAFSAAAIPDAARAAFGRGQNVEQAVKDYIREHMVENINVAEIAENLHFNPQHLMRVFKKKTGLSIVEYITQFRMDTAKNILRNSELPIRDIAAMVGYTDYAYFTRVFRKEVGRSPTQYRSKCRSESAPS